MRGGVARIMLQKKQKSYTVQNAMTYMQRLHERKADTLTLRGLRCSLALSQKSAEAIVGQKRAIPRSKGQGWKSHGQTEGPNVRMAKELRSLKRSDNNRTPSENSWIEIDAGSRNHAGGVEQSYTTNKDNARYKPICF